MSSRIHRNFLHLQPSGGKLFELDVIFTITHHMKFNNILLVTPDKTGIQDIKEALVEHEVLTCSDPEEAVKICLDNDVHLVIVEEEICRGKAAASCLSKCGSTGPGWPVFS